MSSEFDELDSSPILPKILLAIGFLAVAGIAYFLWQSSQSEPQPQVVDIPLPPPVQPAPTPMVQPEPPPKPEPEPEPQAAVVEVSEPPPPPLPELDDSDSFVLDALKMLPSSDTALELLVPDNILRKIVRTVMALDEGIVVHDYRPVQSPSSDFKVVKIDEPLDIDIGQRYTLDPANYQRYSAWVSAFSLLDKSSLAAMYSRFSPLLEEAYQQHGVDRGSFHNVVLAVVDNLLSAPIYEQDLVLIQPKVFYQYQNTEIERLPQAHRLLVRMGPENTKTIQAGLRELKQHLQTLDLPKDE